MLNQLKKPFIRGKILKIYVKIYCINTTRSLVLVFLVSYDGQYMQRNRQRFLESYEKDY